MTGKEFEGIRQRAGLSLADLGAILRVKDLRGLRRYEDGEQPVSGPVSLIMEMIDAGELPARFRGAGDGGQ